MGECDQKRQCTMGGFVNSQLPTPNAQLTPNAQQTPNSQLPIAVVLPIFGNWELGLDWELEVGRWDLTPAGRSLHQEYARPRSGGPAAQVRVYLALLPSGPDAVRRLNLHRVRTAVRRIPDPPVYYKPIPGTFQLPLTFYKSGAILSIIYRRL